MKTTYAVFILFPLLAYGLACSPSVEEPVAPTPPQTEDADVPRDDGKARPPLISAMPPQPPGPAPETVQSLPKPPFRMPKFVGDAPNLGEVKAKSQYFVLDNRSPVINGNFERWEKPGPIHWSGNFTYKKPSDPPEMDIQMFPSDWDGEWALRFMPLGKYIELWQDVKLPELEGGVILDATAYVRNPIPPGFAIRITYVAGDNPQVGEVYPAQAAKEWTRYHSRIRLPANVARTSVRLYLTRDASIDKNIIVDALSVAVVGATGAATAP